MITPASKYYSKILLFGEYTLLLGSRALTVPFLHFSGRLDFNTDNSADKNTSNVSLQKFYNYLANEQTTYPTGLELDLNRLKNDIDNGLYLDSDIPQGYGVGSSGVLVAAVYNKYANQPLLPVLDSNLSQLKIFFSFMESYFHGRSSGLDPLSCYVQRPLLVSSPDKTEIVDFPSEKNDIALAVFLLDTGMTSRTDNLVQLFLERVKDLQYMDLVVNKFIPLSNSCVDDILKGDIINFMKVISVFSSFQLEYFTEMIPDNYKRIWENGINTGDYYLKLCGSGGGGFILGFTNEFMKTEKYFYKMGKKVIPVFKNS